MTITTGAALAPDGDASPDADDEHDVLAVERGASTGTASSYVFVPHVIGGISLAVAPEAVSELSISVSADSDAKTPPTLVPDLGSGAGSAAAADGSAVDSPLLSVIALSTPQTPPVPARPALAERLRAALPFTGPGLTWLGGVVFGCLVVGLGATADLALGHGLGAGFTATFLLGCLLVACALRTRALAVAIVLPPLLFAGGYALETQTSGVTVGRREMAIDVATSLALHAPALFIGTAVAVAVVVVRVAVHLVRR